MRKLMRLVARTREKPEPIDAPPMSYDAEAATFAAEMAVRSTAEQWQECGDAPTPSDHAAQAPTERQFGGIGPESVRHPIAREGKT